MLRNLLIPIVLAASVLSGTAQAQTQATYGMPIGLDAAKKVANSALAEAAKAKFLPYAIAVVDPAGRLVLFERADNTQYGSVQVAIDKARSAALFRRPTKVFEEAVAAGRTTLLGLHGAVPLEGGLPLVVDGKIIGAIGASGGTAPQDGQVAKAGVDALK